LEISVNVILFMVLQINLLYSIHALEIYRRLNLKVITWGIWQKKNSKITKHLGGGMCIIGSF
jgi:hypothetical protein